MSMGRLEEAPEGLDGLVKRLGELLLLLVPPSGLQAAQPGIQAGEQRLEFVVETIEILSKSSQFHRIDIGFCHVLPPSDDTKGGAGRRPQPSNLRLSVRDEAVKVNEIRGVGLKT